jgi:hypothetical protein
VIHAFFEWLGFVESHSIDSKELFRYFKDRGVMPNAFSFWIGNILLDFGTWGSLIFFLFYSSVVRSSLKKLRRTGIFSFSNYVLFLLLYQIMYFGVFYFRYFSVNYYILFCLLLWFILKLVNKSRSEYLVVS